MGNLSSQDDFLTYLEEDTLSRLAYFLKKLGFCEGEILKNYVKELSGPWLSGHENEADDFARAARMVFYDVEKEHEFRINKKIKPEN